MPVLLSRGTDSPKGHERADGTVKKKSLAQLAEITDYMRSHNAAVEANGGSHPETGRPKLREILLSGGDPMVLPNTKLAGWFTALAEAGAEVIPVGTKELAFHPDRFDDTLLSMLDRFHEVYPEVALRFMVHFNHPDELLLKDPDGNYITGENGHYQWNPRSAGPSTRSCPGAGSASRTSPRSSAASTTIPTL